MDWRLTRDDRRHYSTSRDGDAMSHFFADGKNNICWRCRITGNNNREISVRPMISIAGSSIDPNSPTHGTFRSFGVELPMTFNRFSIVWPGPLIGAKKDRIAATIQNPRIRQIAMLTSKKGEGTLRPSTSAPSTSAVDPIKSSGPVGRDIFHHEARILHKREN